MRYELIPQIIYFIRDAILFIHFYLLNFIPNDMLLQTYFTLLYICTCTHSYCHTFSVSYMRLIWIWTLIFAFFVFLTFSCLFIWFVSFPFWFLIYLSFLNHPTKTKTQKAERNWWNGGEKEPQLNGERMNSQMRCF